MRDIELAKGKLTDINNYYQQLETYIKAKAPYINLD